MSSDRTCEVCGRTILPGERTRTYMSQKGDSRLVCELCRGRAEERGWVDPAAPGANVGRRQPPAAGPDEPPAQRLERAVARFNASEATATVAALARALGEPWVSVGAAAGSPSEARITVAWELSWYQWGVDLGDERRPVFQLGRGAELGELDGPARQWNATAGSEGRLALGAPGAAGARDGEPVAEL